MAKQRGGSAPPPPDPRETARAEAEFNRIDTYSPSGSGIRWGYTDSTGRFRQGSPGRPVTPQADGTPRQAQRSDGVTAAAPVGPAGQRPTAGSEPGGNGRFATPSSGQSGGGPAAPSTSTSSDEVWPEGTQAAQKYVESPTEKAIRLLLEPASVDLVDRVVVDNIDGLPDAPRADFREGSRANLAGIIGGLLTDRPDRAKQAGPDGAPDAVLNSLYNGLLSDAPGRADVAGPQGAPDAVLNNLYNGLLSDAPGRAEVAGRGDIAAKMFERTASALRPEVDKANERLLVNLQNRGIPVGSEAFNESYGEQLERTNEAFSRLALDSDIYAGQEQSRQFALDESERDNFLREIGLAGQEQNRRFGLDQAQRNDFLTETGIAGNEQNRLFNLGANERATAISELATAFGQGYSPPNPIPSGQATPINYSGLVNNQYQAQLAQHQADQQRGSATAGAIGSIGSALLKCTMEAKIIHGPLRSEWAAQVMQQMPLGVWQYKPEDAPDGDVAPHVGPMAEHFQEMTGLGDGKAIHAIDYLGLLAGALQNALGRIEALEREIAGEEVH